MNIVDSIFDYVCHQRPDIYREIETQIRPYSLESLKRILEKHLRRKDLRYITRDNLAEFLLEFCTIAREHFPQAGDPQGILLTCRITQKMTQDTLDGRHLRQKCGNASVLSQKHIHAFTELSQIFELSSQNNGFQLFTTCELGQLLTRLSHSCTPVDSTIGMCGDGFPAYMTTKKFYAMPSFIEGINRLVYCRRDCLHYLFRNVTPVLALTDVKYVFEKCGVTAFFFNFVRVLQYQYFKKTQPISTREEMDIVFVLKFLCSTGTPLPLNRNGLKRNPNRSAIEKLCFEAVKQTAADESVREKMYPVQDSTSKMFFGQPFNEGTGYQFAFY